MPPTITLEAFGQLSPDANLSGTALEEQDFLSVFDARAELMNWSTVWSRDRLPLLWDTYEAALTAGIDASRIVWVYVELSNLVDLDKAMPELRDLPVLSELPPIPEGAIAGWGYDQRRRREEIRRRDGQNSCGAASIDPMLR